MGSLGNLIHGRCRDCGAETSRPLEETVEDIVEAFLNGGYTYMGEAFRPFRKKSSNRPFKLPDWAQPEKPTDDRSVKDAFSGNDKDKYKVSPKVV
jgi:hypothetical protein